MPDRTVCVFDLDHTLVNSPLDLRAVGREMEAFVRARGIPLAERALRWSAPELLAVVRRETGTWKWPVLMFAWMTALAWVASFAVFQIGSALGY